MKIIHKTVLLLASLFTLSLSILAQQVPNAGFEDWSGDKFDGNVQPASWYASNVTQVGFKFNFAHQEAGHTGKYSMMVQDQTVGAAGITETSPGYFSLGQSWVYLESVLKVKEATAGICGGIQWKYRPDSVSVWIKRTGNDVLKENFNIIYYAWRGTARGEKYKGKNGGCTSTSRIDEESDIRQQLDANGCGTIQKAEQIAEGWLYQKKEYSNWTNIRIPIYYMNNNVPEKMNIIFSASNYPNYRSSSGLYAGNSLYVDDVELIYSAKIHQLKFYNETTGTFIKWNGFDPNSTEEQIYSVGNATSIPRIEARRGIGTLTAAGPNADGEVKSFDFVGRLLQQGAGKEMQIIDEGQIDGDPMIIKVTSEDGKHTHTYKIKFIRAASSNTHLAGIEVNGKPIEDFNRTNINYNFALPYGTTEAPVVTVTKSEDAQKVEITQPKSVTDKATIKVTAADKKTTKTYSVQFSVAELSDNTLQDILVNGSSLAGFDPFHTIYSVSLPLGTTEMPTIQAVSAYPEGEQTIRYNAPDQIDGGQYTVSVSTPGNKFEKVYRLNLKLKPSSYSLLKSLSMEGGYIQDFEPENTTYYVNLGLGTMALPKIEYVAGDPYQTIEIKEGGLDGTTRIEVKAADGSKTTYKIIVTTEKSTRTDLQDILIGGVSLAEFEPNKFVYSYELPIGTTLEQFPAIDVVKGDEYEQVTITYGGVNGTTRISVKAGDGSVSIYQILFSVKKATDATLKSITVGGVEIPNYDKTVLEYDYMLPRGTKELPLVGYVPNDEYQIINTRPDGVNGDYKIIVRPQSGVSQTYIIHFTVEVSTNNFLESILVNNTELSDFDPEQTEYSYTLEPGVSSIPQNIVYKQPEGENQKAFAFAEDMVYTIRVTAENGDVRDYVITFVVQKSENAFLENILLDGVSLEGFNKETLTYTYQLADETCPKVTVQSTEGQQVVITQPNGAGVAKILVTPEVGDPNMYQITFVKPVKNTVQLADILVDGVSIDGFDPTKKDYIYTYSKGNPVVTFAKADESQDVQLFVQQQKVFLYVTDGKENNAYTVELKKDLNASTALKSLLIGEQPYDQYDPATTQYNIVVEAGQQIPSVGYERNDTTQIVHAGATSDTTYEIKVLAQNGEKADYKITFKKQLYTYATLANLSLQGEFLKEGQNIQNFDPNKYEYTIDDYAQGAELPTVVFEKREGQNILVNNVSATEQQVIVTAENGNTNTYTIKYNMAVSDDAHLADILIDGVSIKDFDENKLEYTELLAIDTKIVPSVHPVGKLEQQTITTYFGKVDGTTLIEVTAPDGQNKMTYKIYFPVQKSDNCYLEDIMIDDVDFTFDKDQTDYEIVLDRNATKVPYFTFEKAEKNKQKIHFIHRPLGQTSEITVTAENGEERTYKLYFHPAVPTEENVLSAIKIAELNDLALDLSDKTKRDFTVDMPYGSKTFTINYTKNYDEQTVLVQEGGIYHPTVITVKSNRAEEEDTVYTITPNVSTQNPAVLESITVNGTPIADFDKNRFSYIVKLDADKTVESNPIVNAIGFNDAVCNTTFSNTKHWQGQVTKDGFTNIYDIWFYYTKDIIPNGDFTQWTETTKYNNVPKPNGWNCLADVFEKHTSTGTHTFGKNGEVTEVTVSGSNKGVQLYTKTSAGSAPSSLWGGALGGKVPALITLGELDGKLANKGGSEFSVKANTGIIFRNTPDSLSVCAKTEKLNEGKNRIVYTLTDGKNTEEGSFTTTKSSSYLVKDFDLAEVNKKITGTPTRMNILLNSYDQENMRFNSGDEAKLTIDYIKFKYNSTLKNLKANNTAASLNNKAFSVTLTDPEQVGIPQLDFTGDVKDQAQKITWQNPTKDAQYEIRKANIVNYAEDGTSTNYTLEVKRPLYSQTTLRSIDVAGLSDFDPATKEYTCHLTSSQKQLPDIRFVPQSSLQTVTVTFADSTYSAVVKAENGREETYKVKFVTDLSSDATLASLSAEGVNYEEEKFDYDITADALPEITFSKQMDGQTVEQKDNTVIVTAEDGTQQTYTINVTAPEDVLEPQLKLIAFGANDYARFNKETYEYTDNKQAETPSFERLDARDSVIYTQTANGLSWEVFGKTTADGEKSHKYTYTYSVDLSDNALLSAILIDGVPLEDFAPQVSDYTFATNERVVIQPIKDEENQQIVVSYNSDENKYAILVTAESGKTQQYNVAIKPKLSSVATLDELWVGKNELLARKTRGFKATDGIQTDFTITVPTENYKVEEPQIPSINYAVSDGQTVHVEVENVALGLQTTLTVTSQDGLNTNTYTILTDAEPSHNVELQNIAVNGMPIDEYFEASRHYYTFVTSDKEVNFTWSSQDKFQTVEEELQGKDKKGNDVYRLNVTAQDGETKNFYQIIVIKDDASDNTKLANILLDGIAFDEYEPQRNRTLHFDSNNNLYGINIPTSGIIPEVSAVLAQEGQTVTIERETEAVKLNVTAADGEHTNTYTLNFNRVKSSNALLDSVLSGGVAIPNFRREQFYYFIDLPVGTDTANIPTIFTYKAAGEKQTVKDTNIIDTPKVGNLVVKTIITVTAEDNTQQQYDILYNFLKSDADTLLNIRYDGEPIEGFNPQAFQYVVELPVGTEDYPELTWDEADSWQEITKQTVYEDQTKKKEQIFVTSQSGKRNIYMVEFEKLKSDMDMLDAIYLNNLPMESFEGNTNEYYCILADTATVIPNITFDKGDVYQTVDGPRFFVDNMTTKSLGQKAEITVVAQKGNSRTYTLHFPVALSDNPLLNMIFVSGESLPKFDSEQSDYTIKLAENATDLPIISVNKQEEAQKVDIVVDKENWKVTIHVRAEDGVSEFTYNLGFERAKSSDAFLQTILVDGEEMSDFQSTRYEYDINIPYGQTEKPVIEPKQKDGQMVVVNENDDIVSIIVTAADEETQHEYILKFNYLKNDDATLAAINILYKDGKSELLPNFDRDSIEYKIEWPVGSTQKTFITIERLQIILSDEEATSYVFVDPSNPTTIYIEVTAQDEKTKRTYAIYQSIKLSDDNTLKMIYIDGKEYREFDPNVEFYTYLLPQGAAGAASLNAIPNDTTAKIYINKLSAGDTSSIVCEAQNGEMKVYKILFINSDVNDGLPPQAKDILIKPLENGNVQIVSLRKNVKILFTDMNGARTHFVSVPTCAPNDMAVEYDAYGNPIILNVYDRNAGVTVTLEPNKIYFYCTFEGGKKKVVSGKFMIKN